ncbi:MAG: gliding motility lipoprotein GldH [Tannerellaceae bacterium]|jgi:gliding motility-associated lipoprotein GldH|nr:gliding motility lipoprotein GldH [Tannerellaceae bacterium]
MISPTTKRNRRIEGYIRAFSAGVLCLSGLLCFACEDRIVYNQYQAIDGIYWGKDEVYYFTFRIDDAATPYNISFEVRNDNLYPYQNLWVFYSEEQPSGPLRQDTLECMLADGYGKWYGKGISLHQQGFPVRTRYLFPMKGQYTFAFRQGMRNDSIRGIQEIGLRVERAQP